MKENKDILVNSSVRVEKIQKEQKQINNWVEKQVNNIPVQLNEPNQASSFKNIIYTVHENFKTLSNFIQDMEHLRNISEQVRKNISSQLNSNEKDFINNYIEKLDELLKIYDQLKENIYLDISDLSPERVINKLLDIYENKIFSSMLDQNTSIALDVEAINAIAQKYNLSNNQDIASFSIKPVQTPLRFPLLLNELNKEIGNIYPSLSQRVSNSLEIVNLKSKEMNETKRARDDYAQYANKNSQTTQALILGKILDLDFNSSSKNLSNQGVSTYLETILTQSYPEIFSTNDKKKINISTSPPHNLIYTAIGVNNDDNSDIHLDPAKFNAEALDELYEHDKNPLWLVLKSTKPIDENFTEDQKKIARQEAHTAFIENNINLVQSYKNGKFGNENENYLSAYNLMKATIAIAEQYPNETSYYYRVYKNFGPESALGKWIIDNHPKKEPSIKATLPVAPVMKFNVLPAIDQILTSIKDGADNNVKIGVDVITQEVERLKKDLTDPKKCHATADKLSKISIALWKFSTNHQLNSSSANILIDTGIREALNSKRGLFKSTPFDSTAFKNFKKSFQTIKAPKNQKLFDDANNSDMKIKN